MIEDDDNRTPTEREIMKDVFLMKAEAKARQAAVDAMLEALKPFAETICCVDCGVEEIGCPREDCDYSKARAAIALAACALSTEAKP